MKEPGLFTIGEFVSHLERSFPGISASKIRYLEREGLLHPVRTKGGYRLFSKADLCNAKTILTLQQDHYLPLKVIRARLKEQSQDTSLATSSPVSEKPTNYSAYADTKMHAIEAAQKELGVSVAFIQELAACGFIKLYKNEQNRVVIHGRDFPQIMRIHELGKEGIEPRNIRFLVTGAGHQIALLEQLFTTRDQDTKVETAQKLARLMQTIQEQLVENKFIERNKEK